jgi:ATP-dependent Lon protease
LELVLLPGELLPLHIFEPRYREMISECLETERPFGVVRAREGGVASVGCTAEIMTVAKKYDDGRMDIVTRGKNRFEVIEVNQERSFLRAEVLVLNDASEAGTPEQRRDALKLHGEIMSLMDASEKSFETSDPLLSFQLASALPMDLDLKQTLLETSSEVDRLESLISLFKNILPSMRRSIHIRRKAGGNGHGGHPE